MVAKNQSDASLADELPALLAERGRSLRGLAEELGVDHGHLSRITRHERSKVPSGDLAGRIAIALGLPVDYFPEYRRWLVVTALADPDVLNRVYRLVTRPSK